MTALTTRTILKIKPLTILPKVANKDQTAIKNCFDTYGNFIWALARKFTASTEEAEGRRKESLLIFGDTPNAAKSNLPKNF